ncbi:MAG: T9SS type A sorting domain-containing protein, partial [Bacteroidota bacterium]
DYKLDANYPNPFNPTTSFSFTLPIDKQVSVKVFDLNGRLVDTLVDNELRPAGTYSVTWDAEGFASGTYIYSLEFGNFRQARRMTLLK